MIDTEQDKHVYFALDSDVLSSLALIYKLQSDNPDLSPKEIQNNISKNSQTNNALKNYNFYCNILSMARQDKIRLLVTLTPFYESKHIYGVIQFVMDFCYLPKVNQEAEAATEEALKIRELAQAYCSPYTNKKGERCKAPINPKYNAYAK